MLPTRLPIPLPGSSERAGANSDVRPSSQWVEPARSGAAVTASALALTVPGYYYETSAAVGSLTSLWIRKEGGPTTDVAYAQVYVNNVYRAGMVLGTAYTEDTLALGFDIDPGDEVRVYVQGSNQAVIGGMLRTPTRLFRLQTAALGHVWIMEGGAWVAPPMPRTLNGVTWAWDATLATYKNETGWIKLL